MLFSIEDIPSSFLRYEANNTPNEVLTYVKDKTLDDKWQFVNTRIGELKDSPDLPAYYLAKIQLLEERGESGASVPVRIALADYCKARARNFLNEGNALSIVSGFTQYAILTYPGHPKSSPGTRRSSYFFAFSQKAYASSSSAFINR